MRPEFMFNSGLQMIKLVGLDQVTGKGDCQSHRERWGPAIRQFLETAFPLGRI
jgi:hypothetical protein